MKAEITLDGKLEITPGSITELYAMETLLRNNWRLQDDDVVCINDRDFPKTTTEAEIVLPVVEKELSIEDVPF